MVKEAFTNSIYSITCTTSIIMLLTSPTKTWSSSDPIHARSLESIQVLIQANHQRLTKINKKISKERIKRIKQYLPSSLLSSPLTQTHPSTIQAHPSGWMCTESQIERLKKSQREHLLKQDFLDRLKVQVDNNYESYKEKENLQTFLVNILKRMVQIEKRQKPQTMYKFLKYLSVAMEKLMEPTEYSIDFIEGYLRASTFEQPISPQVYRQMRHYSNGIDNEPAQQRP